MADKPPDDKNSSSKDSTGSGGAREKQPSSTSHRFSPNASPARTRVDDSADCECLVCEQRRERIQRNRLRLHSESASSSTNNLRHRLEVESPCLQPRRDLRRSLLDSAAGNNELNDSKCQSCPDLMRVSHPNALDRTQAVDGMEGYFNANRHLLNTSDSCEEKSENTSRPAAIPVETHTYHFPPEVMSRANAGGENNNCDNDDSDEGGVYVCDEDKLVMSSSTQLPPSRPAEASSSDDQGDFIEADIPPNRGIYACSSSNNTPDSSSDSSYEDLRTMSFEQPQGGAAGGGARRSRDDDHSYEDLRLLDIRPPPNREHRGERAAMNALSHDSHRSSSMSASSSAENPLSAANVNGDESCRPKTLYGADSLQISGASSNAAESSPVTSMSESSHRTPSSSFLSPQLSDSGATYGIASESSVFMSPDTENFEPLSGVGGHGRPPLLRHRSVDCNDPLDGGPPPFRAVRSSNDLPNAEEFVGAYGRRRHRCAGPGSAGGLELQNIDSHTCAYKLHHNKEKQIDWKDCNCDDMDSTLKGYYSRGGGGASSHGGEARDRSASDASSKKSGRWTCKIVRTGTYQQNPERYTKAIVCNSVYEAWAETRVRNLFYSENLDSRELKDNNSSRSSSEEDLLANINNLNRHRTESSDYEELFNVSRQTSTSNFDQDENSFQQQQGGDTLRAGAVPPGTEHLRGHTASASMMYESRNVLDVSDPHHAEQQENQNNINLETGERYHQQQQENTASAAAASATTVTAGPDHLTRSDPDQIKKTYNDMKTILKRKKYKKRTRTVYVKGKPTRHKLIKFKMRPGQIFQALDYDYIHFNYSDSE